MFKQTPSRNHRGKGIRMKYAIKIFVLVAICIWLLYQVKHSHDQKRAFEAGGGNMLSSSLEEDIRPKIFDAGRKVRVGVKSNHEDEAVDDDEARDPKTDENEDDDDGAGDDKMDENDGEKGLDDAKHGAKENRLESSDSSEHKDQHVVEANSQEAREKQYQEDDASSAVARESRITETEGLGDGSGELIRQQVENPEKKESDFGDDKGKTSFEVGGYGQVQGETGNHTPNEAFTIGEKEIENTKNGKLASNNNQSNATSEVNVPDILPQESGNDLSFNESLTNSTAILTPIQDGDISDTVMHQPVEHADGNSTELSSNNVTVVVHNEAADLPVGNATIALDTTTHNGNSTVEEGKIESSDAEKDISHDNVVIKHTDGKNDAIALMNILPENSSYPLASSVVMGNDTYSMAPANSTEEPSSPQVIAPLESIYEKNSSFALAATNEGKNSSSYEDGSPHLETVMNMDDDALNTTSKAKGSETGLPTSASVELNEGADRELSDESPTNSATGLADKDSQQDQPEGGVAKKSMGMIEDA